MPITARTSCSSVGVGCIAVTYQIVIRIRALRSTGMFVSVATTYPIGPGSLLCCFCLFNFFIRTVKRWLVKCVSGANGYYCTYYSRLIGCPSARASFFGPLSTSDCSSTSGGSHSSGNYVLRSLCRIISVSLKFTVRRGFEWKIWICDRGYCLDAVRRSLIA